MNSKQKQGGTQAGQVSKQKEIPVAEGSLQSRAPGSGPPRNDSEQSAGVLGSAAGHRGSQSGSPGPGERGGPGTQQAGWSSRQQAERMQARGEEDRQGNARQSGYGGAEQDQPAGSQESPTGPRGSQQSTGGGSKR